MTDIMGQGSPSNKGRGEKRKKESSVFGQSREVIYYIIKYYYIVNLDARLSCQS